MDMIEKSLNILFLEIPPEKLLAALTDRTWPLSAPETMGADHVPRDLFARYARVHLANFTDDEYRMFHQNLRDSAERMLRGKASGRVSVLCLPADCGRRCLIRDNRGLRCRFEAVSNWRDVYLNIGQDLVTTAFLAYEDLQDGYRRDDFTWDAVLHTDSPGLERMLRQGIAENHFHLGGSTQSFPLTWCCMMNLPDRSAPEVERALARPMYDAPAHGAEDQILSWSDKLALAACIRGLLYQRCRDAAFSTESGFREHYDAFHRLSKTNDMIGSLRFAFGPRLRVPGSAPFCLDYAMEEGDRGPFRILAGERRLMYRCFTRSFTGEFSRFENDLFYLYLMLKANFRREWIQVNRRTGFQSFSDYQDRKSQVWKRIPAYCCEARHIALNGAMAPGAVQSLEARLSPESTAEDILKEIWSIDRDKRFAGGESPRESPRAPSWRMGNFAADEPFFYTVHFPKRRDGAAFYRLDPKPRHARFRDELRSTARALAEGLRKSDYLCQRIRGIDACANEIGCRPEVFASEFRSLRGLEMAGTGSGPDIRDFAPGLSLTYHAGEDFLDIADGLRAIDEAVFFLNFRRGDRLGHALALGIEPRDYYGRKDYKIIQTNQDRLDDLVWSLYRGMELGVVPNGELRASMEHEARMRLQALYGGRDGSAPTLSAYYSSWKLRGDDPWRYRTGAYLSPAFSPDLYDRYRINRILPELDVYRESPEICRLYSMYHFDERVREEGSRVEILDVTVDYADYMRALQDQVQREIAKRGFMIECNPSSNVLIGSFRAYHRHPIFRFYDRGLEPADRKRPPGPQLNVSINTDDLGVFDTSLEFEYALVLHALLYGPDRDAEKCSFQEAKAYLEQIRQMGFDQIFPPAPRRR